MLLDRGYDTNLHELSISDIKKKILNKDLCFTFKNTNNKLKVIYLLSRIKPSTIKNMIDLLYEKELEIKDEIIFITKESFPSTIDKMIDDYYNDKNYYIQIFNLNNLQFNITKHDFVPKHKVLKKKEAEDIINKYNLNSRYQLPFILKKDAIAKYYGMKSGDICEITRNSETSGKYVSYRCCK